MSGKRTQPGTGQRGWLSAALASAPAPEPGGAGRGGVAVGLAEGILAPGESLRGLGRGCSVSRRGASLRDRAGSREVLGQRGHPGPGGVAEKLGQGVLGPQAEETTQPRRPSWGVWLRDPGSRS